MRNLGKMKLSQLSKAELKRREMNGLRGGGGDDCYCRGGGCGCSAINGNDLSLDGLNRLNQYQY